MDSSSPRAYVGRWDALDIFRGIAILGMVLQGTIAYRILPAWMYHAQLPPPTHDFDPQHPGLTWVDLVFPFFLFAMGAALALANGRRLALGESRSVLLKAAVVRWAKLTAFAYLVENLRPFQLASSPGASAWAMAIVGFGLLSAAFGSFSAQGSKARLGLHFLGYAGALLAITLWPYEGGGALLSRVDMILLILANASLFGSLVWIVSYETPLLRWAVMAGIAALVVASGAGGMPAEILSAQSPLGLIRAEFLPYLLMVLPGTRIGDSVRARQEQQHRIPTPEMPKFSVFEDRRLVALAGGWILYLLVTLQGRWLWQAPAGSLFFAVLLWVIVPKANKPEAQSLRLLVGTAVIMIILGLILEPFQGGIKKDPVTLSYCLLTTGCAGLMLLIVESLLARKQSFLGSKMLLANGRNPLVAYVIFGNLIWPILHFTGLESRMDAWAVTLIPGFLKGVIYTSVAAVGTDVLGRRGWVWKT